MAEYTLMDIQIKVLSPLHVGCGETLMQDYDYVVHGERTWRLNLDALLSERVQDPQVAARLETVPPGTLLHPADYVEGSPLFRYVLRGAPRSKQTGAQVQEHIKDVWDRPYLPGSSLKGALRTALIWHAFSQRGERLDVDSLDTRRRGREAAQSLERALLGSDPNHDLLRALQVSDSDPVGPEALMLANVRVLGGRQTGGPIPIEVEALRPGTQLQGRLKVDTALLSDWARRHGLSLGGDGEWLQSLPAIVQRFSAERAARAKARYAARQEALRLVQFYQARQAIASADACYLQLGWGGGWDSKTLGPALQDDPPTLEAVVQRFGLRRGRAGRAGGAFPATQRMVVTQEGQMAPLGWVRLDFVRRSP